MTKVARLLEQFVPEHYNVSFNINPDGTSFSGTVEVKGESVDGGKEVTLHANGLTITKVTINGNSAEASRMSKHHEVKFMSGESFEAGDITLVIDFEADISPSMVGIYASNFEHDGKAKKLIATQFEANHAREAFPCVDEPSAKATYQLTMTTNAGETVISNTPVESQNEKDGRLVTTFEQTPRMSSYLLAFVTGEMHSVETQSTKGIELGCWSSVAMPKKNLEYALSEAAQIIDFFEDYYGVEYPLPKCDLVALPDFDSGAMENWGIITFREVALLADPDNRSISSEQYVSLVVAHELAHMWFGNLVTMAWWDDLWLNESFASIMEHVALNAVHPDWHQWEHYAAMDIITTTSRDIHKDIQPISIELDDPDLISTMFDPGIVYTKGARLMKMLIEYVGEDTFRKGLKRYFTDHAYQNATRDDLWAALDSVSDKDVSKLMSAWLDQPGMPMLSVTQDGASLTLEQQRFIVDGTSDDSIWPVPTLTEPAVEPEILESKQASIELSSDEFVTVNSNAGGHYITHYTSDDHRAAINARVTDRSMDASARINYLNDLQLLSRADLAPLTDALDVVAGMKDEDRHGVWSLVSRTLASAMQVTEGDEGSRTNLKVLRRALAEDWHKELGIEDVPNDDPNTIQLRNYMFSMMLAAEDESAVKEARSIYEKSETAVDIPAEARAIILSALVRDGDDTLVDSLMEMYPNVDAEMQLDIVSSLASTRSPETAQKILSAAIGPDGFVRPQDLLRWLAIFLRNHYVRVIAWDYLVEHWSYMEETLLNSKSFDYLPTYCAAVINSDDMAKRYKDLFEPLIDNKMLTRNITIGLADIEARVAWRHRNEESVIAWLSDFAANQS